jgi:hypothetical protein
MKLVLATMVVVIAIGLNVWYDYYHPLGIVFDLVVVVIALIRYLSR